MPIQNATDMWNYVVTMTDRGTNPLFAGSDIFVFAKNINMGNSFTYDNSPILLGSSSLIDHNYEQAVGSVDKIWGSSIGYNAFISNNNSVLSIDCTWVTDVGSFYHLGAGLGSAPIMTPYKARTLGMSGRQIHLQDERVVKQISIEGSPQYNTGIPVVITGLSFKAGRRESENSVDFTITMREDR